PHVVDPRRQHLQGVRARAEDPGRHRQRQLAHRERRDSRTDGRRARQRLGPHWTGQPEGVPGRHLDQLPQRSAAIPVLNVRRAPHHHSLQARDPDMTDHSMCSYDYIVVGGGAAGSVVAGELSRTGADVLLVEAGGIDSAPTIGNPSIWFYNVGGALDWNVPIAPVPQLHNRKFNMALGRVLGGGSSINAMVWSRGMDSDYDGWERNGAAGWCFKDVLPMFRSQEDWEGGENEWRGAGGPIHVRRPGTPHPTAPAFLEAARQMGFALLDDVNGPLRAGAGYINMNIAADGSRISAARAFLQPNLDRPNLTILLDTNATKVLFEGDRAVGVELASGDSMRTVRAMREVILAAGTIHTAQ